MLSTKQFGQNKVFRFFTYAIVIGFALLMFLPGSYSVFELFQKKKSTSASLITVNGVEILYPKSKLEDFISKTLAKEKVEILKQIRLETGLSQWQNASLYDNKNPIGAIIKYFIASQLTMELAKDLGYSISKDKLAHSIAEAFKQEKENHFKDKNTKNTEFISFPDYAKRVSADIKKYYIRNMVEKPLNNGVLVPMPTIVEQFKNSKHQVKVDFALYTYDHFIKEPDIKSSINDEDLKKHYQEKEKKIMVKEGLFSNKDEARDAKNNPEYFVDKPKTKDAEKKYTLRKIPTGDKLYEQLKTVEPGQTSDVISNDKTFSVYQILSKDPAFEKVKEDPTAYQNLIEKYAKDNYALFKDAYANKAKNILEAFLSKSKDAASFSSVPSEEAIKNLRIGRTDYFNVAFDETDFSSKVLMEKPAPAPETDKDKKEKPKQEAIKEFHDFMDRKKKYNESFFKNAFTLKNNETSGILSEDMKNQKLFFIIKKVDEKKPGKGPSVDDQKKYLNQISSSDKEIFRQLWVKHLEKKYEVKINHELVFQYFGLKPLRLPGTKDKKEEDKKDDNETTDKNAKKDSKEDKKETTK